MTNVGKKKKKSAHTVSVGLKNTYQKVREEADEENGRPKPFCLLLKKSMKTLVDVNMCLSKILGGTV